MVGFEHITFGFGPYGLDVRRVKPLRHPTLYNSMYTYQYYNFSNYEKIILRDRSLSTYALTLPLAR